GRLSIYSSPGYKLDALETRKKENVAVIARS
ncbi:MAG: hypothetical protein ACI8QN_000131, partial [Porticoccaceae bacterium]